MVTPDAVGILILLFFARTVSLRATLLCIPTVAVTTALVALFVALAKTKRWPISAGAAALLALGIGAVTNALLGLFFINTPAATEPTLAALFIAIGCAAVRDTSLPLLTYPAVIAVGLLRELLATGQLWGFSLFSGISTAFADVTGGMLLTAAVCLLFGLSRPVLETVSFTEGLLPAAIPVSLGVLFRFVPQPPLYALWTALAVCTFIEAFLSKRMSLGTWLVTVPFLVLSEDVLPFLLVFGFTVIVAPPLVRRLKLFPPLRRFAGVPATAVITAVVRSIVSAVF